MKPIGELIEELRESARFATKNDMPVFAVAPQNILRLLEYVARLEREIKEYERMEDIAECYARGLHHAAIRQPAEENSNAH